jgi:glycosyltransferase involved in cell wall biosynthesis
VTDTSGIRLGVIVPRYGPRVHGGAEHGVRRLAEEAVARLGWRVEVFTTASTDATTWADVLEAGTTVEAGVTVHRFASVSGRAPDLDGRSAALAGAPETVAPATARRWLEAQGPYNPALVDAAVASDCTHVACTPYLYWPIVEGLARLGGRAVFHPAAHDEWVLRLPLVTDGFATAPRFAFYTAAEARLVNDRFPALRPRPQAVVGLGVDAAVDGGALPAVLGRPYVLCLGRVDRGKGAHWLARARSAWPDDVDLVLAGPVNEAVPAAAGVHVLGTVDEATKWALLRGALALCSPSGYESFSIVLLEAWQAGVPVLVNARCAATVEHVTASRGGLAFGGVAELAAMVERLRRDADARGALAAAGAAYVAERFSWDAVLARYARLLQR